MKKISLLFIFCILCSPRILSQKIHYGGMQQFGVVVSESDTKLNFTITNGIRFSRFFTGIGISTQFFAQRNYGYFNIPFATSALFLDGRYYLNKKKQFFTKLNGGVNLITQRLQSSMYDSYKKHPGYYGAVGLGFKARIGKEIFYSFDLNYCMRQTRYDYKYHYYGYFSEHAEKYDFRQSLIIVSMGIEFF